MRTVVINGHGAVLREQPYFHNGRLLCWSSALVTISLWSTTQFLHRQNLQWKQQLVSVQKNSTADEIPPSEAFVKILERAAQKRQNNLEQATRQHKLLNASVPLPSQYQGSTPIKARLHVPAKPEVLILSSDATP